MCLALWAGCGKEMTPEVRLSKLRTLVEKGEYERAHTEIAILLPEKPTDSTLLMLAIKIYLALDIPDSAHTWAKQYTALYPTRLEGYHVLYETGGKVEDYDAQIWAVSQLGYLENDRRKYHRQIAELNYLRGEYGMAMVTCKQILEYDPTNPQALFVLANSLAAAGRLDSAIVVMEQLDRLSPDKIEILSNLASFLASSRDYEKAAVHFRHMTSIYPDYMPGWFGLGNVLLQLGDTAGSRNAYRQVYSRDSTFLGVDSILRELDKGRLY